MSFASRVAKIAGGLVPRWAGGRGIKASGYSEHGASTSKKALKGWRTEAGGPDRDILENLETLRERSRDLCMGEGLAIGALRTIRTNEIGAGLRLNAQIDGALLGLSDEAAQAWEDRTEREFALWAGSRSCDASRRSTFGELQALARLSQLMSGDVFALLPSVEVPGDRYDLRVQLLEADRVSNPDWPPAGADIQGGVEVGRFGEPLAFWVASRHPGETAGSLRLVERVTWDRIPARGDATGRPLMLHLMEQDRPGQRRGVPLLSPVIEKLKQLSRYSDAELMAAVVSGFFTAAITSESPQTPLGQVLPPEQRVDDADPNTYELGNGALLGLAPGEGLTSVNPARPNGGFDPFVQAVCRQIGAGIGLPYELLVMQFTASYSASRAALLEAWKRFSVGRAWLAAGFCQPIYVAWLEEAIARGYVEAPGFFDDPLIRAAWSGAEWIGPTQGQLDPTAEVAAAALRVEHGFSTRTRETIELTGGDWWENHRLRVREEQARRDGELASGVSATAGAGAAAAPTLILMPSDLSTIATVDEGRESVGLPAVGGEEGARWVLEHATNIRAEAAPEIAEAAKAAKGVEPGEDPGPVAPPEDSPTAEDEADEDDPEVDSLSTLRTLGRAVLDLRRSGAQVTPATAEVVEASVRRVLTSLEVVSAEGSIAVLSEALLHLRQGGVTLSPETAALANRALANFARVVDPDGKEE